MKIGGWIDELKNAKKGFKKYLKGNIILRQLYERDCLVSLVPMLDVDQSVTGSEIVARTEIIYKVDDIYKLIC